MADDSVHILNGPNLNLLGEREPDIYGRDTLEDIASACERRAAESGFAVMFRQSNHEGVLIDWVQEASREAAGVIINPGGYTHTSVALADALIACVRPKIELHLSNLHAREAFRRHSYVSPTVDGVICGFGAPGYLLALDALRRLIDNRASGAA